MHLLTLSALQGHEVEQHHPQQQQQQYLVAPPPGHPAAMPGPALAAADPGAQYAQYQQYCAYMQQQAQYNPGYAMQMQQYYAQYGVAAGGPTPHPAFHPPPQPGYQVQCSSAAASSPRSPTQAEEQTAE